MSRLSCRYSADFAKQPFDSTGWLDYDNQLLFIAENTYLPNLSDLNIQLINILRKCSFALFHKFHNRNITDASVSRCVIVNICTFVGRSGFHIITENLRIGKPYGDAFSV